jgi:hypothetical protein
LGSSPTITITNGTINGIPLGWLGCDIILIRRIGDVIDFDINVFDADGDNVLLTSVFTPSITGVTITPGLPLVISSPYTQVVHFHYVSDPLYIVFLQLFANDGSNLTECPMIFDFTLPIELTSFVSVIHGNDVTLNWTTATEDNNSRFEIERATGNSSDWMKIGTVQGNGNSTTPISYSFTDRGMNVGKYNYRLKQIDFNGNFEYHNLSNEVEIGIPKEYSLSQNYPNPFNPSTKIDYELPADGEISLILYDISGKEVASLINEFKTAGYYTINFNASNLSSGIYFYMIRANNYQMIKKMMVVK